MKAELKKYHEEYTSEWVECFDPKSGECSVVNLGRSEYLEIEIQTLPPKPKAPNRGQIIILARRMTKKLRGNFYVLAFPKLAKSLIGEWFFVEVTPSGSWKLRKYQK